MISLSRGWGAIALGIVFFFVSFTLQSMRFRDMGWDPVCVIPGWIAAMIVDRLIATKFTGVSLGSESNQTIVGALVQFGLMLALLFWPSAKSDAQDFDEPRGRIDAPPRRDAAPVKSYETARRLARSGASFEEIVATCGLAGSEARLLQRLHSLSKPGRENAA